MMARRLVDFPNPHEFHVLTNTIATPMSPLQKAASSQAEKMAKLVYTPPTFLTDETVMAVSYQSFGHAYWILLTFISFSLF
jgi:hypothetical protein